eukprot:TRINITY_DN27490_c0_g1_i1.p1 TRINITY_DN27490_c0_g1~~TRINITY_DN27490_c0_g1_i1.p1  ORF type:complete len:111 (+),score=19.32 TRINITY_DN27490_c0_g1_i1:134-466(+)
MLFNLSHDCQWGYCIQYVVKTPSHVRYTLRNEWSDTIADGKRQFMDKQGLPVEHQLWVLRGSRTERMEDDRTFEDYRESFAKAFQCAFDILIHAHIPCDADPTAAATTTK